MFEVLKIEYLKKIVFLFGEQRKFMPWLLLSFILGSLIDFVGIGIVGPFLTLILSPESLLQENAFLSRFDFMDLVTYSGILLIIIFALRAVASYFIYKFILGISYNRQIKLRSDLATAFLSQDFSNRLDKNSGYYQTAIVSLCSQYTHTAVNSLRLISELCTVIALIILLLIVDHKILFTILIILSIFFLIYIKVITSGFSLIGKRKIKGFNQINQTMTEIVKGLKEIKILNVGDYFAERVSAGATISANSEKDFICILFYLDTLLNLF